MFSSSRTFSFDEAAVIDYLRNPDIEYVEIEDKKIKAITTYWCENYITYLFSYTYLDRTEEYYANLQMWNWKEKSYMELIDLELEDILAFFFPLDLEIKEPGN